MVTVHTPLSREVFGMNMPKSRDIHAKFNCRRQSGMNFGYVTENGVNSNVKCVRSFLFLCISVFLCFVIK